MERRNTRLDLTEEEVNQLQKTTQHNTRVFTDCASYYDATMLILPEIHASLVHEANLQPGHSVLDIGTGTGELAFRCKEQVGTEGMVVGLDCAQGMLDVAQAKNPLFASSKQVGTVTFLQCDCFTAEMQDFLLTSTSCCQYDRIFLSYVEGHITTKGDAEAIDAIKAKLLYKWSRLLKPDGTIIMTLAHPERRPMAFMTKKVDGYTYDKEIKEERFTVLSDTDVADMAKEAKQFVANINANLDSPRFKVLCIAHPCSKKNVKSLGRSKYQNEREAWEGTAKAMWEGLEEYRKTRAPLKLKNDLQPLTCTVVLGITAQ